MDQTKVVICPYCGETQPPGELCRTCGGLFEPLSRQATHNDMGPWFIRDLEQPFRPGCSYETLAKLVDRGDVTKYSLIRGPTTKQFWTVARHVPGVAHLLGYCHACDAHVDPDDLGCASCGVPFGAYLDRNHLGLPEVRPLPWEAGGEEAAAEQVRPVVEQRGTAAQAARGISSFAADHELRAASPGRAAGATAEGGPRPPGAGDFAGQEAGSRFTDRSVSAPTPTSGQDWLTSPAVRSMQRRMARQQRTIRLLSIAVIVLAVAAAVFNIAIVASMDRQAVAPRTPDPALDSQSGEAEPPAGEAAETPHQAGPVGGAPEEGPKAAFRPPAESPGDPGSPVGPPELPAVSGFIVEYRRALLLAEHAADASRTAADRRRDYEEALLILRNIADNAPEEERPEDLAERIAGVEAAIEALR
jgi:hypothetical protein